METSGEGTPSRRVPRREEPSARWFQAHAGIIEETVQLSPVWEVGSQFGINGLRDDNCAFSKSLEKSPL